jgi:RNA polymerase primary sigma factor
MTDLNSISDYLKEIRKFPLLGFEEELELSRRIQGGDLSARKKLIESNLRLVVNLARKYALPEFPLLDIIQEGNLGLITAAQKYEFSYNVRFSTYACWWIQQSITRAIANKKRMIRLPFRKEELAGKVRRATSDLFQLYSRNPTIDEIADELGISRQEVSESLRNSSAITSLDVQFDDEDSASLKDIIPDSTYSPEDVFMKKYTHACVQNALSGLKVIEQDIMCQRYNLSNNGSGVTLKALATQYGVSAETIRQMEIRALKKLRNNAGDLREIVYG